MKIKQLALVFFSPFIFSGCAVLNTADHSDFSCEDGNCPTPLEVYYNTNSAPSSVSVGKTPETWGNAGGSQSDRERKKSGSLYLESSLDLINSVPGSAMSSSHEGTAVRPLRKSSQTMRIWVAPWVDLGDNLHWNGFVFTEVVPRQWSIGEQEVRHQSTILATSAGMP